MSTIDIIKQRHSVRRFKDIPLDLKTVEQLNQEIEVCNKESGLHIQLITNELMIIGPKGMDIEAGYYGERIVLKAQELGVNSCWVALTYKKNKAKGNIEPGEKLYLVIALGYGETNGVPHKSKSITDVSDYKTGDPEWYRSGIESALLAPTAVNQQKFKFERNGEKVDLKVAGLGFYTKIDLGIVKYHFEIGSGKDSSVWI